MLKRVARIAAPIAGKAVGGLFGGPAGAMLGSKLAGLAAQQLREQEHEMEAEFELGEHELGEHELGEHEVSHELSEHEAQADRLGAERSDHCGIDGQHRFMVGDLHLEAKQAADEQLRVGLQGAPAHRDIGNHAYAGLLPPRERGREPGERSVVLAPVGRVPSAEEPEPTHAELTAEGLKKQQGEEEINDSPDAGAADIICATGRAQRVHQVVFSFSSC